MKPLNSTPRTKLKRARKRANPDREAMAAFIDETLVCQIAFTSQMGPMSMPTAVVRMNNDLYIHGSNGAFHLKQALEGKASLSMHSLDGLVLSKSAFHHSVNFRSVMVFGAFQLVEDEVEKRAALETLVNKISPNRYSQVRGTSEKELRQTKVVKISLDEASFKTRSGLPVEDDGDENIEVWAGTVNLKTVTNGFESSKDSFSQQNEQPIISLA